MLVRIELDKPQEHFTNLDFLTGKVVLHFVADAAISAVTIKLEGESRTLLSGPKPSYTDEPSDKRSTEVERHKLLYRVEYVFPTRDLPQQTGKDGYMLSAGHHEYPFRFKFPFNNSCPNNNMIRDLKWGGMGIAFNPDVKVKHVKKTLPPSLTGFPGEAEIKYYVKATVVRPKFYQENIRSQLDIKFLPIEPPRPPDRLEETFARRRQQFARSFPEPEKKKGLFSKSSTPGPSPEPPSFQVDARLPNPAIITCHQPLPLRILVQKLNESTEAVFLSMLQIELIGYTHVRARHLQRSESGGWVIMTQSNMNIPLGLPSDPLGKEWKVPSRYWDDLPLPNTVAPSFDTCNISRTYELEVRIGLSHGNSTRSVKPELIVLPLRLPVTVYSGIAPPPELLRRIAATHLKAQPGSQFGATAATTTTTTTSDTNPLSPSTIYPPTPLTPLFGQYQIPAPLGTVAPSFPSTRPAGVPDAVDDEGAPPSYEDAMADEIAPVDGPRRDYHIPTLPERTDSGFGTDSKGGAGGDGGGVIGGLGRRVSERLFPQTGAGPGGAARSRRGNGSRPSSGEEDGEGAGQAGVAGGGDADARLGPPQQRLVRKPTLPPSFEESSPTTKGDRR